MPAIGDEIFSYLRFALDPVVNSPPTVACGVGSGNGRGENLSRTSLVEGGTGEWALR
jgi:hypothetical protein